MNTHELFERKCIAIYNQGPTHDKPTIGLLLYDSTSASQTIIWDGFTLTEKTAIFAIEFQHNTVTLPTSPSLLPYPKTLSLPDQLITEDPTLKVYNSFELVLLVLLNTPGKDNTFTIWQISLSIPFRHRRWTRQILGPSNDRREAYHQWKRGTKEKGKDTSKKLRLFPTLPQN